ncbi:sigma-70 family RNA polymerase sigma factor [Candidatus Manganitrophus noduliformans]|uniref:Sigma-70 family RNA polymerase sigma factor n=1 Tax=Candidatus Manganitrophus noduliformans TaxID=2606439 RepID=A0A7X6DQ76_9BACT|nr:sigma-70 family RNA polymerase sigma factor [Candidatus Manganitrophus noduliformans]NKE71383.1 sigma-70 family RNA polymerase sigma factor [Candidatus Manganitrophus noduliformans]
MKNKDPREFEETTLPFLDSLYRYAALLTGDRDQAEDLVQETYLRACRFFDRYERGTHCKAWLMTILRNIFINQYHQRSREVLVSEFDEPGDFEPLSPPGVSREDGSLKSRIARHDLKKALEALPAHLREVVLLKDAEGFDYKEIGRLIGVPLGTVMSRLFRARNQLKRHLKDYESGPFSVTDRPGVSGGERDV